MRQAVDYRHEQVARAVARACDVRRGVEVVEEHGGKSATGGGRGAGKCSAGGWDWKLRRVPSLATLPLLRRLGVGPMQTPQLR